MLSETELRGEAASMGWKAHGWMPWMAQSTVHRGCHIWQFAKFCNISRDDCEPEIFFFVSYRFYHKFVFLSASHTDNYREENVPLEHAIDPHPSHPAARLSTTVESPRALYCFICPPMKLYSDIGKTAKSKSLQLVAAFTSLHPVGPNTTNSRSPCKFDFVRQFF